MSENITHTAILDDLFRLMAHSDEICVDFKDVAESQHEFARLGSVTRSGDRFIADLLEGMRSQWADRQPEMRFEQRLAFALGWICHRAADRQMKPVFRQTDPDSQLDPTDCSVYHDAFVFRAVFVEDPNSPYHPAIFEDDMVSLPAVEGLDIAAVRTFFQAMLQARLIELHTFIPDRDDITGWIDRLSTVQQRFTLDLDRYAAAITKPDPDKVRRFITEVNFYDAGEPIISTARAIQRGETVSAGQVAEATQAGAESQYAQALKMGFGYLKAASQFFTSEMRVDVLKDLLDSGKKGRDGLSV